MAVFELGLVLDRIWPHKDELDIVEYMTSSTYRRSFSGDMENRADRLIYFALTLSAKKDSYAKTQILASCHKDAVPCVMKNEGKKLYQMFNSSFNMTNLHQASLPTVRAEFYSILQKDNESILKYSARVDTIVSTMAKLGERVSSGAWIYALGNGLRNEFKESKDGILYNKDGYGTVMSVKTKLLSEEAVLNSKSKKDSVATASKEAEKIDEIALASLKLTAKTHKPSTKTPDEPKEQALLFKGKRGKGSPKGKGHSKGKWRDPQWENTWTDWNPNASSTVTPPGSWIPPSPGKEKGKDRGADTAKGADSFWCDIHQRYGHSTDWCFENPHRSGGPPPSPETGPWCTTCNRSGHTADYCYATSIRIPRKGKGKTKAAKGNYGNRAWKSQNFPAGYASDQATPVLHDVSSSSASQEWWEDHEPGSVILESEPHADNPVLLHTSPLEDYVAMNAYDDDDTEYIANYIDLVLFAIVSNLERVKVFHQNPTDALLQEIHNHSASITNAENCLNVHIRRLVGKFKLDVNYDGLMSEVSTSVTRIAVEQDNPKVLDVPIDERTDGLLDLDVDLFTHAHIQPIFFLDDADDAEIAAYIDAILAAIRINLKRIRAYLKRPSPQLRREIIEHSASLTTAENCTNVHIQRIIRNFKVDIQYHDIKFDAEVDDGNTSPEVKRHDHAIANGNEHAFAARSIAIDIGTSRTTLEPGNGNQNDIGNGNEIGIGNEIGNGSEIGTDIAITQFHHELENGNGNEIENTNGKEIANSKELQNGNENAIGFGNENGHGNEIGNEIGNGNEIGIENELGNGNKIGNGNGKAIGNGNEIENGNEIGLDMAIAQTNHELTRGNEIRNGSDIGIKHDIGNRHDHYIKRGITDENGNEIDNKSEIGFDISIASFKHGNGSGNGNKIDHNFEHSKRSIGHANRSNATGIVAEIERTKHRIQAEIADTMTRTNTMAINQTTIYIADEANRAQQSMDAEIMRLNHMLDLMHNLHLGIKRATLDLRQSQDLTVHPIIDNECSTIENERPTKAQVRPTIDNESSTIQKECPTKAHVSPTIDNEGPTIENESQLSPTIDNESPTIENESPTKAQVNPTIAKERPLIANQHPTIAPEIPTLANESPPIAHEDPTFANECPTVAKESVASNIYQPEFLLMITDQSQLDNDERTMLNIDAERTEALRLELQQLELQEQRTHDLESIQLHEDATRYHDDLTDQMIASFERRSSSDDYDAYGDGPAHDPNSEWWTDAHDFAQVERAYNLDADTESEDETVNIADLLDANMKLLTFLTTQSQTIARLRTRIVRLKSLICDLSFRPSGPFPDHARPPNLTPSTMAEMHSPLHESASPPLPQVQYFGIQRGHHIGVCDSWEELQRRTAGFSDSVFQSFSTWQEAKDYVIEGMWRDMPAAARPFATPPPSSERHSFDAASVLVDTVETTSNYIDTSFLLKPNGTSAVDISCLDHTKIQAQLATQLAIIKEKTSRDELWMYFDSGASRSVISTTSPVRKHLQTIGPAYGSCSIGDGTPLNYLEKGRVTDKLEITVVKDLKYDLFSSVSAAKQGLTSIIDYDLQTGENQSFTIDKLTGNVTPLVERGKGILELPLHLMLPSKACIVSNDLHLSHDALPPNIVSMFWHHYDDHSFDHTTRENNTTEYSLFTFDIIKSLSEKERHFLIHARLGHLPRAKILQMIKNGTTGIGDYSGKFKELCKPCLQAKQRAENHGKEHKRHPKGRPGEHLHSDLAILSTADINGNRYVLTVVDEISHEIVVALLKRKTAEDVQRVCEKIQLSITARTGNKLLTWQFDRGTEFLNRTFEKWLKMGLGVIQRFSNIEHPWENGMAERSFQTLFATARSLLKHADLPDRLWGKAILHSVYLTNRSPAAALGGIAPLQFRTKEPIDLLHMRVFGSPAQIFVRPTIRSDPKLSDRSVSGTLVGISDKGNGYIFLINKSTDFVEIDSKDAKFNETFSDYRGRQGKIMAAPFIDPDLREESEDSHKESKTTSNKMDDNDNNDESFDYKERRPTERPKRHTTPRQYLLPGTHSKHEIDIRQQQYSNLCLDNIMEQEEAIFLIDCMEAPIEEDTLLLKELELLTACATSDGDDEVLMQATTNDHVNLDIPDPKSQSEIDRMDPKDAMRFNDATRSEVNGMKGKNVFVNTTMADLPPNTKVYESVVNWTSKTNLGIYVKTKCRICFGGHRYDKSYADTFAPTVNFCTVLVIICLSAMFGWAMGSLDYSQAYLNADIDEICVMRAPISVREYSLEGKEYFWLLKKAIYGHPKASRLWAECLHNKLLQLGYTQFLTDQCVYGRWQAWDASTIKDNVIPENSHFIFLLIHSDDIIIVSHNEIIMNEAKAELLDAFEGTDNGNLTSFCGVEVRTNDDHTSLSMEYYWNKLMRKFNVKDDEVENSPIKTKIKRSECPAEPDATLKTSYLQIIGSIIYGYTHCRLDLAFPVNMLTRIMHSPAEQHYQLLRKLLHYINGTKNWTLNYYRDYSMYYGMDFIFFCNVDAAHADDDETHRSTGGWFFFLRKGQGAVSAKSGQTKDIPLSSTESETIWGSSAAMQGAFIKQFLDETRLFKSTSFEIHEDSQPMINAQKRNVSQSRFKHMRTKHHYIRKLIFDGWCKLIKISTKTNTADMATKILPANQVSIFSKIVLGLQDSILYFTEFD